MNLRLGMLLAAVLAISCFGAASAAAAPAELKLDPASGAALPSAGGKVELNLVCDGNGKQNCDGRIEVLARGNAEELESVLASNRVSIDVDVERDPHIALSDEARQYLRDVGPLPVTLVIRRPDGSTFERQLVIVEPKLVPIGAPTVSSSSGASSSDIDDTKTWTWTRNLRAGTAAAMGTFRCPAAFPLVAIGGGIHYGYAGRVKLDASEDVGYAAFDDVIEKPFWDQNAFGGSRMWTMVGWWEGNLFRNSIWAPPFKAGKFTLSITCTRLGPSGGWDDAAAWLYQEPYKGGNPSVSTFMPWVRSVRYP